jgi:hypothetical protein
LYLGLRTLFYILADEPSAAQLGLPTLNGELFHTLDDLDNARLSNRAVLQAIDQISYFTPLDEKVRRRVNYAALDVEELGSVYESLLEFQPVILQANGACEFTFAVGTERRSTGSFYTAPQLVGELIQNALVPVLHERLKSAKTNEDKRNAILALKVLDLAAGSGHFLLAAARTLGRELAKIETQTDEPSPEMIRVAVREVITHCIYGVDKNPLAVDLCKVALWLEGHAEGKPLTFIDHRIRCGDSLVGVRDLSVLQEGIPDEAFEAVAGDDKKIASALKRKNRVEREAKQMSMAFDATTEIAQLTNAQRDLLDTPDETPAQIRRKKEKYKQLREQNTRDQIACHLWTATFFSELTSAQLNDSRITTTDVVRRYLAKTSVDERLTSAAIALAEKNRFFHWALEFPEVFAQGGFDVVMGNPPFIGGLKLSTVFGDKFRNYLMTEYSAFTGTADLCAAFYRRAFSLARKDGMLGMVATNTIGQGDTRESGLAAIVKQGGKINFARRFIKWQGAANVEVNLVGIRKGTWNNDFFLDGERVEIISSRLDNEPEAEPVSLSQNTDKAFIAHHVRGAGFFVSLREAESLVRVSAENNECLLPYLNGDDFNKNSDQSPSRRIICFFDWSLDEAQQYPDLLKIVEQRVKPERENLKIERLRKNWWLFEYFGKQRYEATSKMPRVLVRSRVSELHMLGFVPGEWVFGDALIVFALDDDYHFALLQSNLHEAWVRRNASTMRTDIRYTPSDCFDTFPFPQNPTAEQISHASEIGAAYHEHRRQIMLTRQIGLTATYNLFNNPQNTDADIARLRELHTQMDYAILASYGWQDLQPQHGFHQNERGQTRYTVAPAARREMLQRLVELNAEVAEKERQSTTSVH